MVILFELIGLVVFVTIITLGARSAYQYLVNKGKVNKSND